MESSLSHGYNEENAAKNNFLGACAYVLPYLKRRFGQSEDENF
jgi:hypothetical protein